MSKQARFHAWALGVLLAAAVAAPGKSEATTLRRFSLEEQVDVAELIFVGTVLRAEVALSSDGSFPYTYTTFAVERALKGEAESRELTLRLDGGATEREVVEVVGVPRFAPGERYLLFVHGNGRAACPLVGWGQGRLRFVRDDALGRDVLADERGVRILGIESGRWVRGRPRRAQSGGAPPSAAPTGDGAEATPIDPDAVERDAAGPDESASAAFVLDALEQLVRQRAGERSFRAGGRARSADPRELPDGRGGPAGAGRR